MALMTKTLGQTRTEALDQHQGQQGLGGHSEGDTSHDRSRRHRRSLYQPRE
jgi:hypothetical protein